MYNPEFLEIIHKGKDRVFAYVYFRANRNYTYVNFIYSYASLKDGTILNKFQKRVVFEEFEDECKKLKHSKCHCCHRVSINLKVNNRGICPKCVTKKDDSYYLKHDALPTWTDRHGKVHYRLPDCLKSLSQAEKLLIQLYSPFVPLHHMKKGTFGLSGHVCAFEQDVEDFITKLPRSRVDTNMIRVVQTVKAEIGGCQATTLKAFRVRKDKVFEALVFLKEHSTEYRDIEIDMAALDWIQGKEGVLDDKTIVTDEMTTHTDNDNKNSDMGPASKQAIDPGKKGSNVTAFGYIDDCETPVLSKEDALINEELQKAVSESSKKGSITVPWPCVSSKPVNEYSGKKLFARAFPWLFPGGVGDVQDYPGDIAEWGENMLYYEDGWFASDKIFCFFAMNYIVRHRNSSSGRWFIDSFQKGCPDTLEELKEQINNGNTTFINSLTYYNKRVKGSSPYWFQKRSELYEWINHHVEAGNGAPMFFITLSCAEYFWADVIDLLKDRLTEAGIDTKDCYVGSEKLVQITNDYAIVIQEYFQKRTEIWLKTVGKAVFGIDHYWVRYEFAPGRGQIHAHLLAIPRDQSIYDLCHYDLSTEKVKNVGQQD